MEIDHTITRCEQSRREQSLLQEEMSEQNRDQEYARHGRIAEKSSVKGRRSFKKNILHSSRARMSRQSTTLATTTRSTQMLRMTTSTPEIRWLHHCTYRCEKQVLNVRKFITVNEKTWCPVHLKIRQVQGNLSRCFQAKIGWIKKRFPTERIFPLDINRFSGAMNPSSDSLSGQMLRNLFLMETEFTCLLKQDLNSWSRSTKWNLLTLASVNSSNKLMLSGWNWRTPFSDMQNLEESKFECRKNWSWKRKHFETLRSEVFTKWENWREVRNCELTNSLYKNWENVMRQYKGSLHRCKSCKRGWILWTIHENFKK